MQYFAHPLFTPILYRSLVFRQLCVLLQLERLKRLNEELTEKLESSELQVAAVSTEYRNVIHQKEVSRHRKVINYTHALA